jgi:lipopolysaccharide export system permease protein
MLRRALMVEVLRPFLAWTALLCVLLFVMAFLKGSELLLGSAVTGWDLGRLAVFLLPQFLTQALPIAFLLATLLGLGRLSEDGEINALQALGVSPAKVVRAPMLLSVGVTALLALLMSTAQPWGQEMVRQTAHDILRRNLMKDLKPGVFHEEVHGLTLYTGAIDPDGRLRQVLVHDERDPDRPLLVLASSGRLSETRWENIIDFALEDGVVHRASRETDEYAVVGFGHATLHAGVGTAYLRRNQLNNIRDQQSPGELLEAGRAAAARGEDPRPYEVTLHWRLGQMLMPLSFAFLGGPLAITRRRGGRAWGVLFTLVGYVGYYLLARLSVQLADSGALAPALAGQIANVIFIGGGLLGLWLVVRRGAA